MELNLINKNNQFLADSREVAEMVGKPHNDLMKSIRTYIEYLGQGSFSHSDFFIESTYLNTQNKEQPCYLITRKGCDMVANKMTGEKGVLFTAVYVTKFEEMEKQQKPTCIEDVLIQSLQEMKDMRQQLNEVNHHVLQTNAKVEENKQEIQGIRDVITLNPNSWRSDTTKLINAIASKLGGYEHIKIVREESYKLLDERAGAKLSIRLTNRRRKVLEETGSKSKANKVSKLDVIADDKRLTEVYIAIIKEIAIKNGIGKGGNF